MASRTISHMDEIVHGSENWQLKICFLHVSRTNGVFAQLPAASTSSHLGKIVHGSEHAALP